MNFASMPKYCINLTRRTDRREHAEAEFQRLGLEVEFVTAVDGRDIILPELSIKAHEYYAKGNWACVLSHLSIIKRATSEYILVCEDDIRFCDDLMERMEDVERSEIEFDLFYLGGGYDDLNAFQKVSEHLYQVTAMSGTYAYIMRNTVFDFILRNITYDWGPDQFFSDVLLKRFRGLTSLPMMATPIGSPSDIGGPTPA